MRRLKNDRVNAVSASSELTNYGADYLLDEHPSRLWKADNTSNARLTVDIVGGCSDIMLFGTNAISADVTVEDPNFMEFGYDDSFGSFNAETVTFGDDEVTFGSDTLYLQSGEDEFANSSDSQEVSATSTSGGDALHIQLDTAINVSCVAYIDLAGSGSLYAGKIIADHAETYGGYSPLYRMKRTRIDRSIQSDYPRYYSKRDIPKQWLLTLRISHAEGNQFSDDFDLYGSENHGWKITDVDGSEFLLYGFASEPEETFDAPDYRLIVFYLTEVK